MLYNSFFTDYESFKKRFYAEDGRKKDTILLAFISSSRLKKRFAMLGISYCFENTFSYADIITAVNVLFRKEIIRRCVYRAGLCGFLFCSEKYRIGDGICEDGDISSVRYTVEYDEGVTRVFKMKAGRLLKKCLDEATFGNDLPEKVKLWLCEEFQRKWEAERAADNDKYANLNLVVSKEPDAFDKIYDKHCCEGDFGSCMSFRYDGDSHTDFYKNIDNCYAAYLENQEGFVVARCIIFEAYDEDGNMWRLAERQYSTDGQEIPKRILVQKLISGGFIDGYKRIGAGCHENTAFVSNDGSSLSKNTFHIKLNLDNGDIVSYQDSFVNYYPDLKEAYNRQCYGPSARLDTTDLTLGLEWDEYHENWATDVIIVIVHGERMYCASDELEDFVFIGDEYYHEDDVRQCPYCNEVFVDDYGVYSELTEEWYCCDSCLESAEEQYKKDFWEWSEWDEEYFESVEVMIKDGERVTISPESLNDLEDRGLVIYDGEYRYKNND